MPPPARSSIATYHRNSVVNPVTHQRQFPTPLVHRGTGVDRYTIATSPKRAACWCHCNGTTRQCHAVNSVAECGALQRCPDAPCASEAGPRAALFHCATAQRARPKCASGVESLTPSATAEVVGVMTALWLQRASQLLACGAQATSSFFCNPPAASRGQPMSLEAHMVAASLLDGLSATGSIGWQRQVAKGRSADLTTAPTCSAEEPVWRIAASAADWLPIFTGTSSRALCCP